MPFVVIVALVLGSALTRHTGSGSSGSSGSGASGSTVPAALPPVTVSPPPSDPAALAPCAKVIGALPLRLGGLSVRQAVSTPSSPSVVAWGDPAVVLRCGVARPAGLTPTAQVFAVNGVNVLPHRGDGVTVFTVIDRPVYIEVSVPTSYAQPPLGPIATAVAKTLPQICTAQQYGQSAVPTKDLCVNRPH